MSWIDDTLNSSLLVWVLLLGLILHIYLKKTNQTLPDLIRKIKESFVEINKDE
jgi:hypothetical protein